MKSLNRLDQYRTEAFKDIGNYHCGQFLIHSSAGNKMYLVVATDELGWEHVSVSLRTRINPEFIERCPLYEEMEEVKRLFFNDDEVMMQIYPKDKDYVNMYPYVLHLWRKSGTNAIFPNQVNSNGMTQEIQSGKYKYHITVYENEL